MNRLSSSSGLLARPDPQPPEQRDLARAAQDGDLDACRDALARGADPQLPGPLGRTPLGMAAAAGRAQCCELLSATRPLEHRLCDGGLSPLAWAARGGWTDCVAVLLKRAHPWDLDPPDMSGRDIPCTPLVAAIQGGSFECFEMLLKRSPLHGRGPCPPPLIAALDGPHAMPMARILLEAGADPREEHRGASALFKAIEAESIEALRLLLPLSLIRSSDGEGRRPLERASRKGWEEGALALAEALPRDCPPTHFKRAAREARFGGHPQLAHALEAIQRSRTESRSMRAQCSRPISAPSPKARL